MLKLPSLAQSCESYVVLILSQRRMMCSKSCMYLRKKEAISVLYTTNKIIQNLFKEHLQ